MRGEKFKQLLKEKRKTQQEIAKTIGVHQTLISQWCTGKGCPNIHQVSIISNYLCVSVEEIINCFENNQQKGA